MMCIYVLVDGKLKNKKNIIALKRWKTDVGKKYENFIMTPEKNSKFPNSLNIRKVFIHIETPPYFSADVFYFTQNNKHKIDDTMLRFKAILTNML